MTNDSDFPVPRNFSLIMKYIVAGILLLVFIIVFRPFQTIAEYERGVITRFGLIVRTAEPGLNWKLPFVESIHVYPVNIRALSVDKVMTYTVDNQQLDAKLNVNYRIPANGVVNIYKNVQDYQARLQTLVIDRFKSALGKMNVVEVTKRRADTAHMIFETVRDEAARLFGLEVVDFQIVNIDYTKEFEQATEQAMTAKAGVERREQEKRQAEVEAERVRIEATGKANAQIEAARGEAESRLAIARAEAEAIRLQGMAKAETLKAQGAVVTDELVEMRKAEQWNGQLPAQMLGGTVPLMQVGGK